MLVKINEKSFNLILNIIYATKNNFTNTQIYKKPVCLLHEEAANKLKIAIDIAEKINYKLKIYDGFRPIKAQHELWDYLPDENYVSNPNYENAPLTHCRGIALDLTLVDCNGKELDMGTEVDSMLKASFSTNYKDISSDALLNRLILKGIMITSGFTAIETEWWHFQLEDYQNYPIVRSENNYGIM
ncbi:MAG: D-alanyl-D-alanine dipeptidase [Rickettsiaceae bacterium H1]|nr:D-alanyl-D-alanine dipeptidase [Rickettsiaceae bacterium H1]